MQACARIGAVHSVVFGGFSANAVKDRIEDAGAKLVITADGGWRGGHAVELKRAVDKALAEGCESVQRVIVYRRTGDDCTMRAGRDIWWHDAVSGKRMSCEPEWVDAEHPLFLLYTSGSTGKPKGIQHSQRRLSAQRQADHANGYSISRTTMSSGVRPMSAGLPDTPTSSMGRWRPAPPCSCTKARRPIPTAAAFGRCARRMASLFSIPRPRPFAHS